MLPPLPEQRKIAEILSTWDEALEKLTTFRAAKQDRFTGLTQQLMGRGGVFPQQWPLEALSVVSTPVRRKSAGNNHPVMTISAKSGFLKGGHKMNHAILVKLFEDPSAFEVVLSTSNLEVDQNTVSTYESVPTRSA